MPLIFALDARSEPGSGQPMVLEVAGQFKQALIGLTVTLLVLGLVIVISIPHPRTVNSGMKA
jgi:hypothetical protein